MRASIIVSLVGFVFVGLSAGGCVKATLIGTPCTSNSTCTVKGQVCAPGFSGGPSICTHSCTGDIGTTGCPVGYDCFPTDPKLGETCNKVRYDVTATGTPVLFGLDCGLDNGVCVSAGSTNAMPTCRKIPDPSSTTTPPGPADTDPNAYCTGVCATDGDCPLDFICKADYDTQMKCLKREFCDPCTIDANCPPNLGVCIATVDGTSRYCTKPCNYTTDCGGNQNTAQYCDNETNAAGVALTACRHLYGACVGQGNICDPCRVKADCAKSSSSCYENPATSERFCSKMCNNDTDCSSAEGKVPSACDNTMLASSSDPEGPSLGICNGDVAHSDPGLFSCYVMQ